MTRLGTTCAAALCAGLVLASVVHAQTMAGRVLEDGSERPIADAALALLDRDGKAIARAESDPLGRFVLTPPRAGEFTVEVSRLGYVTTRSPLLSLATQGSAAIDFSLVPEPIGLEGLSVSVESDAERLLRGYGQTPERMGLRYIDRARIEELPSAHRAKDLLRWQGVPGVYIREDSGSPSLAPLCLGFWRAKKIGSANPPCAMTLLNGARVDPVEANQITPEEIESIAVLTPMDATLIFGTMGGAGAVMIWTRRGGN